MALAGERFDGHDFVADAAAQGRCRRDLVSRLDDCRCPRSSCPTRSSALTKIRTRLAPGVRRHRDRHHRQQRQDHGQGNDRRDHVAARPVPRHAGQPQQPHRRAADVVPARVDAALRGDRDGREPPGRDRAPRGAGRAGRRDSSSTRVRRTSRVSAGSKASRAARARCSRRSAGAISPSINADDRFAALWHGLAREAGSMVTFGMRERADVSASDVRTRLTATGFATVFNLVTPQGDRAHRAGAGRRAQRHECAGRGRRRDGGRREHRRRRSAGCNRCAAWPGRLEVKQALHGARLIDDAYNANPGSMRVGLRALARRARASAGSCSAKWRNSAQDGPRLHAEMGALARACGVTRLFALGAGARPGGRDLRRRRRRGLRTPTTLVERCGPNCTRA